MQKAAVIAGVSNQVVWWMGERQKKLVELRHETMSVNPILLPLIFGIHQFQNFDELSYITFFTFISYKDKKRAAVKQLFYTKIPRKGQIFLALEVSR